MDAFSIGQALHVASSILLVAIGGLVWLQLHGRGLASHILGWSVVLFFLVRGVDRFLLGAFGDVSAVAVPLHTVNIAVLAVMVVGLARQADILVDALDQSSRGRREYLRARDDYERLVRHRMANPIAVVYGAALTLERWDEIAVEDRNALLRHLVEASGRLKSVSLRPERESEVEHELDGVPDVG